MPQNENDVVFRSTGDIVKVHKNTYIYIGRINDMFKRFGTRIVLSEIENKVFKKTQLLNKCIWSEQECKLLLFFFIQDFDFTLKEKILDKLRVKLLHLLSKECLPDFIDILKAIPLTCNGKLDKKALRDLFLTAPQLRSDLNGLEIFNELLLRYFGVSSIKTDKTFLEMGAHSIVLIQFFEEFKSHFNGEINNDFLTMLFEKTIEECRKFVSSINVIKIKRRKLCKQNNIENENWRTGNFVFKFIWKYDLKACVDCSPIVIYKRYFTNHLSCKNIICIMFQWEATTNFSYSYRQFCPYFCNY